MDLYYALAFGFFSFVFIFFFSQIDDPKLERKDERDERKDEEREARGPESKYVHMKVEISNLENDKINKFGIMLENKPIIVRIYKDDKLYDCIYI